MSEPTLNPKLDFRLSRLVPPMHDGNLKAAP